MLAFLKYTWFFSLFQKRYMFISLSFYLFICLFVYLDPIGHYQGLPILPAVQQLRKTILH